MAQADSDDVFATETKVAKSAKPADPARASLDQLLVKNAWMRVEVDDDDDIARGVRTLANTAKKLDGYVASRREDGITFKVPTGRLDEALAVLPSIGEVVDEQIDVQDVTDRYVDLEIRIENLRKLRGRLQELLTQGETVKDVLEVEKELARVTGELEQLEGQMRLMKNQVAFATVSVTFEESVSPGPVGWVFYGLYSGVKWLFVWD